MRSHSGFEASEALGFSPVEDADRLVFDFSEEEYPHNEQVGYGSNEDYDS